ncbi:hypothetical protein P175DRAFT_0501300 [Aspergillus ochraceoroseus IBT 24754]|uniref:Uncharacterized protein n=1 Tax=Aspergillus ochraceoroseus IBT 24754 TaxID=1392256 RepID=A0A2T5LWL7_9EURO|nr:uncharacterized protein P175DRAFT_0501300 [Aspergillus ochraceoroseus IBT 24754]PTU20676.1 hypothetical protein P175DRAFT_0501300 [Aspergillus ochraceoroseus IBT 24754]
MAMKSRIKLSITPACICRIESSYKSRAVLVLPLDSGVARVRYILLSLAGEAPGRADSECYSNSFDFANRLCCLPPVQINNACSQRAFHSICPLLEHAAAPCHSSTRLCYSCGLIHSSTMFWNVQVENGSVASMGPRTLIAIHPCFPQNSQ